MLYLLFKNIIETDTMRQTISSIAALAAAVCLLAGCQSDSTAPTNAAITFNAKTPAMTRAIIGESDHPDVGVFAYSTGTATWEDYSTSAVPNLMSDQLLAYNGGTGAWEYMPLQYWPKETGAKVSFFAYMPKGFSYLTPAMSTGSLTVGYTWAAENDLLYAASTDRPRPYPNAAVELLFRHALAKVNFKVRKKTAGGANVMVTKLVANTDANTSGTFSLLSGTWTAMSGSGTNSAQALNNVAAHDVTASAEGSGDLVGSALLMPGTVNMNFVISYEVGSTTYSNKAGALASSLTLEKNYEYDVILVIDGDVIESYVLRPRSAEQW